MEKRFFVALFLIILLAGIVPAEEVIVRFTAKQNTMVNVTERCKAFGFPCNTNFTCNLTIESPDKSLVVLNQLMTRQQSIYNYSLEVNQSEIIGIYENTVCCQNLSNGNCNTFYHEVTPSGRDLGVPSAIIYVLVLVGSLGLFVLVLYGAIRIPWRHPRSDQGYISAINYLKHFKISLVFCCYLLLLWILNILIAITNNFLFIDIPFNFFKMIYMIFISLFYPIIGLTIFIIFINLINDKRIKGFLKRGIKIP